MRNGKPALAFLILVLLGGCAHYPLNKPLAAFEPEEGYRFGNLSSPDNSDELFVVLTFSGGGTRAAALAYGVIEQLKRTYVFVGGHRRRLLDEVDVISSVSGGSFTAAYYALYGDSIFETFEDRFLKHNVQGALVGQLLSLGNWLRLMSPTFGSIDVAAEYYDEHIFEHKTFSDLLTRGERPFIIINATDMTFGAPFEFTQDQFDMLYSDLSSFPVARAVAASSAFPVVLTPVTLHNYRGQCDFEEPDWIEEALSDRDSAPRRFRRAKQWRSYADVTRRPYIHLLDGGVADNLGVRAVLHSLSTTDSSWSILEMMELQKVRKVAVIVVNARTEADTSWDEREQAPGVIDVASATINGLLDNYTFESAALLAEHLAQFMEERRLRKAWEELLKDSSYKGVGVSANPFEGVKFYSVEVCFDRIKEQEQQHYFKKLPTTFVLEDKEVDCLKQVGAQLLYESNVFQDLVTDLSGSAVPVVDPGEALDCRKCERP